MHRTLIAAFVTVALVAAPAAHAGIPLLDAQCPGKLSVHAEPGGPIYVNGKQAKLKRFNDNYYEATDAARKVVISLSLLPDGSPSVSYTGPGRANGVCEVMADSARDTAR